MTISVKPGSSAKPEARPRTTPCPARSPRTYPSSGRGSSSGQARPRPDRPRRTQSREPARHRTAIDDADGAAARLVLADRDVQFVHRRGTHLSGEQPRAAAACAVERAGMSAQCSDTRSAGATAITSPSPAAGPPRRRRRVRPRSASSDSHRPRPAAGTGGWSHSSLFPKSVPPGAAAGAWRRPGRVPAPRRCPG